MTHVYWFLVWWVLDDLKELKSLFLRIWRFTFNSIMSPHSSHSKNIMISLITKDLKQKSKLNLQVILSRTIFPSGLLSFVYQWLSRILLVQHRTSTGKLWMLPILVFCLVFCLFFSFCNTSMKHFGIRVSRNYRVPSIKSKNLNLRLVVIKSPRETLTLTKWGLALWHVDWNHIIKLFHFLGNSSALKPWFHK